MPRPGFERILELSDAPPDHRRQVPEPLTRLSTLNPSALLSIDQQCSGTIAQVIVGRPNVKSPFPGQESGCSRLDLSLQNMIEVEYQSSTSQTLPEINKEVFLWQKCLLPALARAWG